jgi:hypothetical protein
MRFILSTSLAVMFSAGVALAQVALAQVALAQDDATQVLDDASDMAQTTASDVAASASAGMDDADRDAATELAGAQAAGGPLAYGTVTSNGTRFGGTSNFSSSYNSTFQRYEIQIAGESYYYLDYATVITPAGDARFCKSSSVGGRLLVYCYDASGLVQQSRFGFITYKP